MYVGHYVMICVYTCVYYTYIHVYICVGHYKLNMLMKLINSLEILSNRKC